MRVLNIYTCVTLVLLIFLDAGSLFAQERITFVNHRGVELEARIDERTGTADRIYGIREHVNEFGFEQEGLDSLAVVTVGGQIMDAYSEQLGMTSRDVIVRKIDTDGSWWFAEFRQRVQGIPVENSEIGFTIDPSGNIVSLGARAFPNITTLPPQNISKEEALRNAHEEFSEEEPDLVSGPELVILPEFDESGYSYFLTWKLTLRSLSPLRNVTFYVDTQTGVIQRQVSNLRDNNIYGTITGEHWLNSANDSPVTDGFRNRVKVYNSLGQLVSNSLTNSNGSFSTGPLSFGVYTVRVHLENPWIQIRDIADSGDPIFHEESTYPGEFNFNWQPSDGGNVLWHATAMYDFIKQPHLNYSGMDYQMEGFINSGSIINGAADGTNIYFGSYGGLPWARSRDVVTHEYTHNVIYSIYDGFIGEICVEGVQDSEYFKKSCAMDEGISDYFAATTKASPSSSIGVDVGVNRDLFNDHTWSQFAGPHFNGQVIGGALYRLRQSVGTVTAADYLAFKALQIVPRARDFEDYLYNVYLADNGEYDAGWRNQITSSFSHHDITTNPPPLPPPPPPFVDLNGPSFIEV
ncbi:MAG: hypothetical protein WDZ29_06030 [Balneolaceae bacterium]